MERTKQFLDGLLNSIWGAVDSLGAIDFSEKLETAGWFILIVVVYTIILMTIEAQKAKRDTND